MRRETPGVPTEEWSEWTPYVASVISKVVYCMDVVCIGSSLAVMAHGRGGDRK